MRMIRSATVLVLAILRAAQPGLLRVTARADGLRDATLTLQVR